MPVSVTVTGVGPKEQVALVRRLGSWAGRPIDVGRLEQDLLLLSGTDRYELLTYHLIETRRRHRARDHGAAQSPTARPS